MVGFILLWGWLALLVQRFDSRMGLAVPHFMRVIGLGAMVEGGILAYWLASYFPPEDRELLRHSTPRESLL
jgi:hypothetical protein